MPSFPTAAGRWHSSMPQQAPISVLLAASLALFACGMPWMAEAGLPAALPDLILDEAAMIPTPKMQIFKETDCAFREGCVGGECSLPLWALRNRPLSEPISTAGSKPCSSLVMFYCPGMSSECLT